MPMRISGLSGSGLDIDTIVSQLVKARKAPIDTMSKKKINLEWQRDAYREMNTSMTTFLKQAEKIRLEGNFVSKAANITSSDAEKVKVSAQSGALNGNFSLTIRQIAKSATLGSTLSIGTTPSAPFADVDTILNVTGSVGTADIKVNAGDSIKKIVSSVNAQSTVTGVKATFDEYSSKINFINISTGSAGNVMSLTDKEGSNLLGKLFIPNDINDDGTVTSEPITNGKNASVSFNNGSYIDISSNTFTMNNINFSLLSDPEVSGSGQYTINGNISLDEDAIVSTIKGVIEKYNELINNVNTKINEQRYRNYLPLTDEEISAMKDTQVTAWTEKAKSGLLRNDSILSAGLNKMRLNLSDKVDGVPSGQISSLEDIGITTVKPSGKTTDVYNYLEKGTLYIDEDKLRAAIRTSPEQVSNMFTKDGMRDSDGKLKKWTDAGIGTRMYENVKEIMNQLAEKVQIVPTRSYIMREIDDYTKRISQAEYDLNSYENQLYKKYSALDTALGKLNSQGSQLSSLFSNK